jgi:hypothetical protein
MSEEEEYDPLYIELLKRHEFSIETKRSWAAKIIGDIPVFRITDGDIEGLVYDLVQLVLAHQQCIDDPCEFYITLTIIRLQPEGNGQINRPICDAYKMWLAQCQLYLETSNLDKTGEKTVLIHMY